jgi:hypothetical protein
MRRPFGGFSTLLVAGATAACGLLMLGGVGPSASGGRLVGDRLPPVAAVTSDSTDVPITVPPVSEPITTTSTTTTSPTTTSTTTTSVAQQPSPVPLSVTASQTVVGVGGTVEFSGECGADGGQPSGPVVVWLIGATTSQVATDVTATEWTYRWTAPTDPNEITGYTFQFWCGDPTGWEGGYPVDLQRTVDIVAQAGPVPITVPLVELEPPNVIPATG